MKLMKKSQDIGFFASFVLKYQGRCSIKFVKESNQGNSSFFRKFFKISFMSTKNFILQNFLYTNKAYRFDELNVRFLN